jgi:hypothetical protein
MPLPAPAIDTRRYRDLVAEALARIPVHNPEWNNFNDSDPGVTLLQLFAFMAESVLYRTNLIPDRNRREFLRLLGIPLQPARPARAMVAFTLQKDAAPTTIELSEELYAGSLPFVPERGLIAYPIEGRGYVKQRVDDQRRAQLQTTYDQLYASIRHPLQTLDFYETRPMDPPVAGAALPALDLTRTVDRSVWLALFALDRGEAARNAARSMLAGATLTLGVVPAPGADGRVLLPAQPATTSAAPQLVFERPDLTKTGPAYLPIDVLHMDDVLSAAGVVELRLPDAAGLQTWDALGPLEVGVGGYPPALDNADDLDRLITWIRIRTPRSSEQNDSGSQAGASLCWVGTNATTAVQRMHMQGERLPDGTGEPDQGAVLGRPPVIDTSVQLMVNGEIWDRVDDLTDAGPEVPPVSFSRVVNAAAPLPSAKAFTLDPATGEIAFGDGARGARPPRGALVTCTYDHCDGTKGLVGIGAINKVNAIPGLQISNPVPTWDAADAEDVAAAEDRIPATWRHRNVLATPEDYVRIARETPGVRLGRVEVIPLLDPGLPEQISAGVVTLMVIPATDPSQPDAPVPDPLFLDTICAYLAPRRIVTVELHVCGPKYLPFALGVGIQAVPTEAEGPLRERVRAALLEFLSPLRGGFDGAGWPLGKAVDPAELTAAAARVRGVAKVTGLLLLDGTGAKLEAPQPLTGLQLPRVVACVVAGETPTAQDLAGGAAPADAPAAMPVPVVPGECC